MPRSFAALMTLTTCLALLAFDGWSAEDPPIEEEPFRILYHEPLELDANLDVAPLSTDDVDALALQAHETMSFDNFGLHFALELESNERMIADLPPTQRAALGEITLLRGKLTDVEGSWWRLTKIGQRVSGMIWDGTEAYVIDPPDDVAAALDTPPDPEGPETIIYRLSDTVDLSDSTCALESTRPRARSGRLRLRRMVEHLEQLAEATATLELDIALVADADFVGANNNPRAAVLANVNVVDGILSEQVGVRLNVTDITTLSSNGSLSSTNPSRLLNQFSARARNDNPGIAHLLTGRDLDGRVVGVAGLGSLCSASRGVGLSQIRGGGTAGALIMAHEIGHNFGAPHDNQNGSPCAGTPGTFLMNPRINGNDTFSQCSLNRIRPVVERAACIRTVGSTRPPPRPQPDPQPAPDPQPEPPAPAPNPEPGPPTQGKILFSANFNANTQGWRYSDDTFRGTRQGRYARGARIATGGFRGGALRVDLGGQDDADIFNMSGGWARSFFRPRPQRATLSFRVKLDQAPNYDPGEFSEALVSVDGRTATVARITGNGDGGGTRSTGWRLVNADIGTLGRGTHRITIGGFNNKKTLADETTRVLIDDVVVRVLR